MARGLVRRIFLDQGELRRLYVDEKVSYNQIALRFGVSPPTVRAALAEAGIQIRKGGNRKGVRLPNRRLIDLDKLRHLYVDCLWSSDRLATHFRCSRPTILARLRAADIPVRHHNDTKRGAPSPLRTVLDQTAIVQAYQSSENVSVSEVARKFGVGSGAISRVLKEQGVELRTLSAVIAGKRVGPMNPNWRPGLTDEERASRRDSSRHSRWRIAVYERDEFACRSCGAAEGGNLNAHHIEPYAENEALRWDVENGVTLCVPCHRAFHSTYGLRGFGRSELETFLISAGYATAG